ncbi:MAG: phage tail tape measure protein [Bacteroidales bacterium]|jgi:TP901 family phage tail tape measure protein|nr:phage tail tape measure protein [Bacteroidales bacterium]
MAVYGLTVGIDADASKFNKEMKRMNRGINRTQREVKDLSKSLKIKWDSKVFIQAQKKAQNSIKQTEVKVKSLKDRLKYLDDVGTDKTSSHYRKIQGELTKTESKAVILKKRLEDLNNLKFTRLGSKLKKVGKQLSAVGTSMTRNLTLPILAAGTAAVKLGLDLDTALRKVSTLFGDTAVDVGMLRNKIQDLAMETGLAATELSEGLYQALSAGVPVTEDMGAAMEFLTTATSLAKAGFTTTEKSVDALTTVINAYGLAQSDAARISDIFLATQNKGKTTVDELAQSISMVIPTAASLGVSFEQVSASLAGLTAQGVPTAQATNSLNQVFAQLGKSGTIASDILKNKTGKTFTELMDDGMGLSDVFQILLDSAEESDTALIDLFGNIRAAKGFMSLTSNEGKIFAESLDAISDSSGSTQSALEKVNGPANDLKVSFQKLKTALQDVGEILIPIVVNITDKIGKMAEKFNGLDDSIKNNILKIAGFVAVLGPLLLVFGKLTSGVGSLIAIIPKLLSALSLLAAHPIILVIMVVIGLLAYLYNSNEKFRESINGLVSQIGSSLQPVLEQLMTVFKLVLNAIMPVVNLLGDVLAPIITLLGNLLGPLLKIFLLPLIIKLKLFALIIRKLTEWLTPLITIIKGGLIVAFDSLKETVGSVYEFIKDTFAKIPQFFEDTLNGVIDFINKAIRQINKLSKVLGFTISELDNVAFKSEIMQDVNVDTSPQEIINTGNIDWNNQGSTPVNQDSVEDVIGDVNLDSNPQTVTSNDYSSKDITIEVTVQNYGEEVDVDALVKEINIKLAGAM